MPFQKLGPDRLVRKAAVRVENGHITYRLLVRPQPTVNRDLLNVAVSAPANWRFVRVPSGFAGDPSAVRWSGQAVSALV